MTQQSQQEIIAMLYETGCRIGEILFIKENRGQLPIIYDNGSGRSFATVAPSDGEMAIMGTRMYRHSKDGGYNADWGIVHFENGRGQSVTFSRD